MKSSKPTSSTPSSLTTQHFPYTAVYVQDMLGLDEKGLTKLVTALGLTPKTDAYAQTWVFRLEELETLRKAVEMGRRGEPMASIVEKIRGPQPLSEELDTLASSENSPESSASYTDAGISGSAMTLQQPPVLPESVTEFGVTLTPAPMAVQQREALDTLVSLMTDSKQSILKEIAVLLEERLSGLDEVVVELIRCKTENDSLRGKLSQVLQEREALHKELDSYKPVQFGFYRKLR
jgi:hypothetical protein